MKINDILLRKLKLTENEIAALNELVGSLGVEWPLAKFKLFGSKANGCADEESDLDVLILLPCKVTEEIRERIIHTVVEINLDYDTNISPLIMAEQEWNSGALSVLPIHYFIEKEGVAL